MDFWCDFNPYDNFFTKLLSPHYAITFDDKHPDYLFYSVFGGEHFKYKNSIKIYFTGENDVPNFNYADYAMGFHHITIEDRYMRFPLYLLDHYAWNYLEELSYKRITPEMAQRKFCNFVYSNNNGADPIRDYFFHELSKYKTVDSGGGHLNNIGGRVADKKEFIRDYKFTIAFENSSVCGYTTEKLVEPMIVNSLPIYWGNKYVDRDCNTAAILWLKNKSDVEELIKEIIRLDKDDEAYLQKLSLPWFNSPTIKADWEKKYFQFMDNIFAKTIEETRRRPSTGFVQKMEKEDRRVAPFKGNYYWGKLCGLKERFFK